jgi:hypothetical protein
MMSTLLRTAFLACVRVLLCLQGMYLGYWAWALWPRRDAPTQFWPPLILALAFAFLGLVGIVTAFLLQRGRRWAAIAAIVIEALWAAAAAAIGYEFLTNWPIDWHLLWLFTAAAALFLVTVAGLLLRPVRTYAGLARRHHPY